MKYVLGIDQGGSKTHAIVADETGHILGLGKSYGACHAYTSLEYAVQAILEAADEALEEAGLQRGDMTPLIGGLTGIDWDYEAELLRNAIRPHFPDVDVKVVNDSIIAMRAATKKSRCGILCAGSGLNCAVQNGGECFTYGYYIPDEHQGGCGLGKMAVQAVFDSHMGLLEETTLTARLLDFFQANTVDELLFMRVQGKIGDQDYLKIPLILEKEACDGDKVAGDIWKNYGRILANYLTVRMEKMGMAESDADIVLSGSIFKCRFQEFRNVVKEEIARKAPNAHIIEAKYEPIIGAAVMGLEILHGELRDDVYERLELSSGNYPLRRLGE